MVFTDKDRKLFAEHSTSKVSGTLLNPFIYAYRNYLRDNKKLAFDTIEEYLYTLNEFDFVLSVAHSSLDSIKDITSFHVQYYAHYCMNKTDEKNNIKRNKNKTINIKLSHLKGFLITWCMSGQPSLIMLYIMSLH